MNQRGNPGVIELAYFAVKGQDVDNIIKAERETLLAKIKAGESVQGLTGGTYSATTPPKESTLTEEEVRVAEAMHLTPDQYKAGRKK